MGMDSSFCFGTLTSLVLIIVYVTSHSKAILLKELYVSIQLHFHYLPLFYYSYLNTIYLHRNCMVKRFIYYFPTVFIVLFHKNFIQWKYVKRLLDIKIVHWKKSISANKQIICLNYQMISNSRQMIFVTN